MIVEPVVDIVTLETKLKKYTPELYITNIHI